MMVEHWGEKITPWVIIYNQDIAYVHLIQPLSLADETMAWGSEAIFLMSHSKSYLEVELKYSAISFNCPVFRTNSWDHLFTVSLYGRLEGGGYPVLWYCTFKG